MKSQMQKQADAYAKIQKKYGGGFIAYKGPKVLASAPSIKSLIKVMQRKGIPYTDKVVIGYVEPYGVVYVSRRIPVSIYG